MVIEPVSSDLAGEAQDGDEEVSGEEGEHEPEQKRHHEWRLWRDPSAIDPRGPKS